MKNLSMIVVAITTMLFGCNQTPTKQLNEAEENLTEAKVELKDAKANEIEAEKAKEAEEWKYFKNEADTSIANMDKDLKDMEANLEKAGKKDKQKLKADYAKAKSDMVLLREKLRTRDLEFENEIITFDNTVIEKNQSFKREFNHDMDEFGKSIKDLFTDNVK